MKGNEKLSGEEGQICVQGAPVADGYIVNGQLSLGDDAFFTLGSGQREIRTGDLGIIKDGVLSLVGRLDNAVNIAGHKIHLKRLKELQLELLTPRNNVVQSITKAVVEFWRS